MRFSWNLFLVICNDGKHFNELLIKLIFSSLSIKENSWRIFWNCKVKFHYSVFLLKKKSDWGAKNVFTTIGEIELTYIRENVCLIRHWNSPQLRETYGRESITNGATDDFFGIQVRGSWCNVGRSCYLGISSKSRSADFFHWLPLWI